MNFTAKSRYALQIMLSLKDQTSLSQRSSLAASQGIPLVFMDQVMKRLRKAGLVRAQRGPKGGLSLGKEPSSISLWDIFVAVEDYVYPVRCLTLSCSQEPWCLAHGVWEEINRNFREILESKKLSQWIENEERLLKRPPGPVSVSACQPGPREGGGAPAQPRG